MSAIGSLHSDVVRKKALPTANSADRMLDDPASLLGSWSQWNRNGYIDTLIAGEHPQIRQLPIDARARSTCDTAPGHTALGGLQETFVLSELTKLRTVSRVHFDIFGYRDSAKREVDFILETALEPDRSATVFAPCPFPRCGGMGGRRLSLLVD